MKYIDADRLREKITDRLDLFKELSSDTISPIRIDECKKIIDIIDSLQQDETQVDKMLCSQVWWEEQGWIMISPDATVEGIDSLLKEVKKKLQQEQPAVDLEQEIEEHAVYMPHGEFASDNEIIEDMEWARKEFRHFYELGLNARKEEKNEYLDTCGCDYSH